MDYKHAAINQYHFDELPEPTQEALYAAAAAEKLNEIMLWQMGDPKQRGNPDKRRRGIAARVYTMGVVLGRLTQAEAAELAGVDVRAVQRAQASFCSVFGVEKKRGQVVREK